MINVKREIINVFWCKTGNSSFSNITPTGETLSIKDAQDFHKELEKLIKKYNKR